MELDKALNMIVRPGLELLPPKMRSIDAEVQLLSIAQQESRFKHRKQIGGPAHGFYQFENGGGIKGVLNHHATSGYVKHVLDLLDIKPEESYEAVVYNDILATVFARLLLWADAKPLPKITDSHETAWQAYISAWRPGKPHRSTWNDFRELSLKCCNEHPQGTAIQTSPSLKPNEFVVLNGIKIVSESGEMITLNGRWKVV